LLLALALVALASPVLAGNPRRQGTAGAQELRIPVSARGLALGGGFIADVGGAEAMYYNPAGVADLDNTEVYLSRMNYIADMKKNFVSAVTKTGFGTIGLMVDVLEIGDIEETTEDQPEGTGRIFSPTFTVIGLNYSRWFTESVSGGLTAKVISESILQEQATGLAFDAGIRYQPGRGNLRLALLLKDFGPDMTFRGADFESFHQTSHDPNANPRSLASQSASFELPSVFQAGLAYSVLQRGANRLDGYGTFVNKNFGEDEYQIGAEYMLNQTLALRAGYVASGDDDFNYGASFGVGFGLPLGESSFLNVDYGHRIVSDFFDDNQILSLKFAF